MKNRLRTEPDGPSRVSSFFGLNIIPTLGTKIQFRKLKTEIVIHLRRQLIPQSSPSRPALDSEPAENSLSRLRLLHRPLAVTDFPTSGLSRETKSPPPTTSTPRHKCIRSLTSSIAVENRRRSRKTEVRMSSLSSSPVILQKPQTPVIPSLPLTISAPRHRRFPPLTTATYLANTSSSRRFSSQPLYDAVSHPLPDDEYYEEDSAIGDCLVYEEGIFDDPFIQQNARHPRNDDVSVPPIQSNRKDPAATVSPENLIPDKWMDVQREINISKKERRHLSQQLEFGKRVEKRRQAMLPLDSNSEEYERFKTEKLRQLKPLVLDEPEPPDHSDSEGCNTNNPEVDKPGGDGKAVTGRAAPRNPRLAVYGGGLEDVSEFFSSGNYDRSSAEKSQGTRGKLFSKEEKMLMNRRAPDLAVAISGKWHPLHTLAASGEFYLANSLLKLNLDINVPDKNGLTAVHKAILGRKQAIFNFLLRESANPFVRDNEGATLMHYAVFTASAPMIKILLLYNVDINLQDNDGWTPLHLAVQSRRMDIIRLLLIKGADKSLKNLNGFTALDLCLYSGRYTRTYEVIKLLKLCP